MSALASGPPDPGDVVADPAAVLLLDVVHGSGARLDGCRELRRHSRQHWSRGWVAAVTATSPTDGGEREDDRWTIEVGWHADREWGDELARAIAGPVHAPGHASEDPRPQAPDPVVELPHEVLLVGATIFDPRHGSHRSDLLAALVARHSGAVDTHQLRLLHTGCTGRLRASVTGRRRDGSPALGWVSWVRYADGWRSLTAYSRRGCPMVRIAPVDAADLGVQVGRLVTQVRGGRAA